MNKITLVASVAFGLIYPILAAEIYVDSASSAQSPDGSVDSPYKTIAAAVNEANKLTGEESTVYVKGNHLIDGADDLVTVTAAGMTICAWGEEKPLVEISGDLSKNSDIESPKVFTIDLPAHNCTVKNIAFRYYSVNAQEKAGNSLGKGGRLFSIYANDCTVSGCEFTREGSRGSNWGGHGVIYNESTQDTRHLNGTNMVVSSCIFNNLGYDGKCIVRTYSKNKIVGNIFQNCAGYYMYAIKTSTGGYFVSNRVVNCSSPIYTTYENWGEIPDAEIAYNIFVSSGIPFIFRNGTGRGMTGTPKIHHNTIIGCSSLVYVESIKATTESAKNDKAWAPLIFDNLIVSGEGSSVIREDEKDSIGLISTSFVKEKTQEPRITGNAYFTTSFSDGSAVYLEGYDLYGHGLVCDKNKALNIAPEFINTTDITSDDYYCLNSLRYPWVLEANGAEGFTSEYIGAVQPKEIEAAEGEYFQVDSFTADYESLFAPVSMTFSVSYSQNVGEVEVSWDFNGDGVVDQRGYDRTVTYVYEKPGDYLPSVKVKDIKTSKEVEASLKGVLKVRLKDAYVDSLAENGGVGSKENPFKTIREGVDACGEKGTVHINGGEGRVYEINSVTDVLTVDTRDVTIKSFEGIARVFINNVLGEDGRPVSLITVLDGADNFKVTGLEFVYDDLNLYRKLKVEGLGEKQFFGYIIDIYGDNATIDNCVFRLIGEGKAGDHTYAIYAKAEENNQDPGEDITVSNCIFKDETAGKPRMKCFHCGLNPKIINNIYTNCATIFYPLKKGACDFSFISNRLSNCSSLSFQGGANQEIPKGVIAYNIFTTDKGTPFINRANFGFTSKDSFIHNNTVVGATNFIYVSGMEHNNFAAWSPQIYNNLLILSEDGIMMNENGTKLKNGFYSSFKTDVDAATGIATPAASFHNNVYMPSGQFSTGTVTELEGYDLSKGLKVENNTVLSAAPRFMSTDMNSPDFMRLKAKKGDYPFSAAAGGYPNYVGAQEPILRLDGMRIIIR